MVSAHDCFLSLIDIFWLSYFLFLTFNHSLVSATAVIVVKAGGTHFKCQELMELHSSSSVDTTVDCMTWIRYTEQFLIVEKINKILLMSSQSLFLMRPPSTLPSRGHSRLNGWTLCLHVCTTANHFQGQISCTRQRNRIFLRPL